MTNQTTSVSTTFSISYPNSSGIHCVDYKMVARREKGKNSFKVYKVEDGQDIPATGKNAPSKYIADDLRRVAIIELDSLEANAKAAIKAYEDNAPAVVAEAPAVSAPTFTENETAFLRQFCELSKGFEESFSDVDVADVARYMGVSKDTAKGVLGSLCKKKVLFTEEWKSDKGTFELIYWKNEEIRAIVVALVSQDEEATFVAETEMYLELKADLANFTEAMEAVAEYKAKAPKAPKAPKASKPAKNEQAPKLEKAPKLENCTPEIIADFTSAVASGKVTTKEGSVKALSAEFKDSKNGGLFEVTLENKKVWKTNFRRITQYYDIKG